MPNIKPRVTKRDENGLLESEEDTDLDFKKQQQKQQAAQTKFTSVLLVNCYSLISIVEPLNRGHIGTGPVILSEVVLFQCIDQYNKKV